MAKKKKNIFLVYLEYCGLLTALGVCSLVPLRLSYAILGSVSGLFFIFDKKHRNRVIDHLLFAGVCNDYKEAKKMARENFRQLGYLLAEMLVTKQLITKETLSDYMTFEGSKKAIDLFFKDDNPTNAIVLSAHYGNWEISGFTYIFNSGHHLLSVMRRFDNPLIGRYIKKQRLAFNHTLCEQKGAMKQLLKALRKGDSICMVIDQHAGRDEGVETTFFGKAVRTHTSPAMLHLRTGVPILVGITKRIGVFKFTSYFADPIIVKPTGNKEEDILNLTQRYTTELEKLIKENGPEQWMWAHRRWLDLRKKTIRTSQKNKSTAQN